MVGTATTQIAHIQVLTHKLSKIINKSKHHSKSNLAEETWWAYSEAVGSENLDYHLIPA